MPKMIEIKIILFSQKLILVSNLKFMKNSFFEKCHLSAFAQRASNKKYSFIVKLLLLRKRQQKRHFNCISLLEFQ